MGHLACRSIKEDSALVKTPSIKLLLTRAIARVYKKQEIKPRDLPRRENDREPGKELIEWVSC